MFHARWQLGTSFGVALVCLALTVSPVLADTELGHTGLVGKHRLFESDETYGRPYYYDPGATCFYDNGSQALVEIVVTPPRVRARDVTNARDSQTVGWRVLVKRVSDAGTETYMKTPIKKRTAYDDTPAPFGGAAIDADFPAASTYFVIVVIVWYRSGSVEGKAKHKVDYYNELIPPGDPQAVSYCPDYYLY